MKFGFAVLLISITTFAQTADFPQETEEEEHLPSMYSTDSKALRSACEAAYRQCAVSDPPWFRADLRGRLFVKPIQIGARVVDVKRSVHDVEGVQAFQRCVARTLRGAQLADLHLRDQLVRVQCPMMTVDAPPLFSSPKRVHDALVQCATEVLPDIRVRFDVVNEKTRLITKNIVFDEAEGLDAPLRACVTKLLQREAPLPPGGAPEWLATKVTIEVSRGLLRSTTTQEWAPDEATH